MACQNYATHFDIRQSQSQGQWSHRDVLLSQLLLPAIRQVSDEFFIFHFQQDSAAAHRARETFNLLKHETPAFISPDF